MGRPAVHAHAAEQRHGDERFRALFEHAPVGVALCELDGSFTDVNAPFRSLLAGTGIDPETGSLDDLGRRPSVPGSPLDLSDSTRAWRDELAAVRAGDRPVARVELPVRSGDGPGGQNNAIGPIGPTRWLQVTAARISLGDHGYLLAHLEDTTPRRLEQQRLVRLALHDDLTGLANRTLLGERLDAALHRATQTGLAVGVLYLDVDDFKRVNDTLGHDAGDALLVAFARRLSGLLRAGDTAGRLGGDEFLVVAGDMADAGALQEVVRRVERALVEPLVVGELRVPVTASLGAVLSRPGEDGATVVRRADAAMYAGKRARRPRPRPTSDRARARGRAAGTVVDLAGPDVVQLTLLQEQAAVADLIPPRE